MASLEGEPKAMTACSKSPTPWSESRSTKRHARGGEANTPKGKVQKQYTGKRKQKYVLNYISESVVEYRVQITFAYLSKTYILPETFK